MKVYQISGKQITESQKEQVIKILNSNDYTGFRYFSPSDLEKDLGLSGIDENVIIDFDTRLVYSLYGVKYGGNILFTV